MKQIRFTSALSIALGLLTLGGADNAAADRMRPDFVLTKLEVVPDSGNRLVAGRKAWIKATWTRTGPEPIGTVWMSIVVDGVEAGCTIHTASGGTTIHTPWTPTFGPHAISAMVDSKHAVNESNEINNDASIAVFAQLASGMER